MSVQCGSCVVQGQWQGRGQEHPLMRMARLTVRRQSSRCSHCVRPQSFQTRAASLVVSHRQPPLRPTRRHISRTAGGVGDSSFSGSDLQRRLPELASIRCARSHGVHHRNESRGRPKGQFCQRRLLQLLSMTAREDVRGGGCLSCGAAPAETHSSTAGTAPRSRIVHHRLQLILVLGQAHPEPRHEYIQPHNTTAHTRGDEIRRAEK